MLVRLTNWALSAALIGALISTFTIVAGYLIIKPNLPEINLVDEDVLQIPLKVLTSDGVLIGEFGDQKRRTIEYNELPQNLKNAFLAAEDDQFFEHSGVRLTSLIRAVYQMVQSGEIVSGGGTITMQVVRGYLLSRDQKIIRKIKEIYLAFELESSASKEEIFSLYLNTIFLGNRSYGVEAAANKYFSKSINELTLAESALIASSAQLPSRINPIRSPERSIIRRNWILGRMYKLGYIGRAQFLLAKSEPINLTQLDSSFSLDGRYIAEIARQAMIERYGLSVYKDGLSVITTIDSSLQQAALESVAKNLYAYDKRHGWREPVNLLSKIPESIFKELQDGNLDILYKDALTSDELGMRQLNISLIRDFFEEFVNSDMHSAGIVMDVKPERIIYLNNSFQLESLFWDDSYQWARPRITVNKLGPRPENFYDILRLGDLIYLSKMNGDYYLDQVPDAEVAFISANPSNGAIKTYIGGLNFSKSNFDRVKQSYPQAGSSFKPFIYASAFANGYKASDKINDAPIIFEDSNLESSWRPENYTGKFYGPIRLREALVQSINIVSIKLLREMGIPLTQNYLSRFGFSKSRLAPDLSLALGSSSFSPAEMVRAYSIMVNSDDPKDLFFIERVVDRNGKTIFQNPQAKNKTKNIDAFPWFQTQLTKEIKPFYLLPPIQNESSAPIDPRVTFITRDILREALSRGSNGRKTQVLNRSDIAGKTGTTNDAISTWFSGFHNDLVTTVWVGTDDFSSLGDNEFGSSIALPAWVDFMKTALVGLPEEDWKIPNGLSYVRVDRETGRPVDESSKNSYFELFLDE
ncbi:transglycosylase domain-containing protein [Gammaproteobacteria bacterium]|nr:transglycosylase domain-containing protein [Gammaproteobacteria bacterium]MDB2678078.1 transglycosylase domain-containing protein [Gammaproteobacteria bacterium]